MDTDAVLSAFNRQIRQLPEPGSRIEQDGPVIRTVCPGDGWNGVTWSDLDTDTAAAAIRAQVDRFAQTSQAWEWKYYSYDQPTDLPDRLQAAGLTAEPSEALLVAELAELDLQAQPPDGVELVRVADEQTTAAYVGVHDRVFGGDHSAIGRRVLAHLGDQPPTVEAVLALADGKAVSAGRVELRHGTEFASIWGGGTLPQWRGRGIFRALVAHRARVAADLGFRYLQVDASDDSRPILKRLGFVELATTTPYLHTP